jgi:hypothetical protein
MNFSLPNLLRRTLFAVGAFAALALAAPSQAQQTVILNGQTSLGTCVFSGALTVTPGGALQVTCTTGTTTGSLFSVSGSVTPVNINSTTSALVTRASGTGTASVNYSVAGAGCTPASSTLTFADLNPQSITIQTSATPGTCVVTITTAVGDTASPNSATITVVDPNATGGGGGGGGTGCPTTGVITNPLANGQVMQLRMTSGTIAAFPVIPPQDPTVVSNVINQGQQPATPAKVTTEISISTKCGVIDTSVPQCYLNSTTVNNNQIAIYTAPRFTWTSQATLGGRGCWAGDAGVQYYVNIRWTYSTCSYTSSGGCGFSEQWTNGPW